MKKNIFPVAQVRSDGTPAIWLTHTHWMLLKDCIAAKYLQYREYIGAAKARRDLRIELGGSGDHPRLKEWQHLDSWRQEEMNIEYAMDLYRIGFEAYKGAALARDWTPAQLEERGTIKEDQAYKQEMNFLRQSLIPTKP